VSRMKKHTQLPWNANGFAIYSNDIVVGECYTATMGGAQEASENAEFIAKACNTCRRL